MENIITTYGGYTALKCINSRYTIVRIFNGDYTLVTYTRYKDDSLEISHNANDCYTCFNKPFNGLCTKLECEYIPNVGVKGIR